ncbi:MAG: hypothetical protein WAV51_00280 [Microgenomates group bacterium]
MITALLSALVLFIIPLILGWVVVGKPKSTTTIILAAVSLISFIAWKQHSPYPSPLNWDIWEHQTVINAILSGHHALFPSQLSDTFGFTGYTTLFHYILMIPQYLFHPNVLGFWWASELYMTFLTSLAAYGLVRTISKNTTTALIAGVVSALYFESSIVFTPYFVLPQTMAALIWVFGFIALIQANKKMLPWIFGIFSIALMATHMIIGAAGILVYILYLVLHNAEKRTSHQFMSAITLLFPITVYALLQLAGLIIPMETLNFGEAAHYMQTVGKTFSDMQGWYGILPVLFIPLGLLGIAKTKVTPKVTVIITLFLTLLAVILSPLAYSMKFYVLFRYMFILVIAFGVQELVTLLHNKKLIFVALIALSATQFWILKTNIATWQTPLFVQGVASHVASGELEAITFIKHVYDTKTTVIVSDPATSYIYEALSGVNSFGGAYMKPENRMVIAQLQAQETNDTFTTTIAALKDPVITTPIKTYLFVVSARYLEWTSATKEEQQAFYFNIWRPRIFTLAHRTDIQTITEKIGIQPVFQNDTAIIFAITK